MNIYVNELWSSWFDKIKSKVADEILNITDDHGNSVWQCVHHTCLAYFVRNCFDKPWTNHMALLILTRAQYQYDPNTILGTVRELSPRLNDFFNHFGLETMDDFLPDVHIYQYLTLKVFEDHTNAKRAKFASIYNSSVRVSHEWVRNKCQRDKAEKLFPFLLPKFSYLAREIKVWRDARAEAEAARKSETDAIVPYYPELRAEAHMRWNLINRLRKQYEKALSYMKDNNLVPPFEFSYLENINEKASYAERFTFCIWDKKSFVLANQDKFEASTIRRYRRKSDSHDYFLGFVKSVVITQDETETTISPTGLWFEELLRLGLIGGWATNADTNIEMRKARKEYLLQWGYGDEKNINSVPRPFVTEAKGVLTQGTFIVKMQSKVKSTIFKLEPIFSAATFGLAVIDIITTTGARISEVLQIKNTKDCFIVKNIIEGDQRITRYLFRVIPKGRTEPENFYLSKESVQVIVELKNMLTRHYPNGEIPKIKFKGITGQLLDHESPYLFQYNYKGLNRQDVTACMRFLTHGMLFQDQAGNPVNLKPHLLRHAFANHLQQVQKLPIDIIASILHQKELKITDYYAEPTDSQVAIKTHEFQEIMASYLEIDSSVLRGPKELIDALKDAKEKVGVYTQALGGSCSIDAICPVKMACVGCGAKIPDPEKKQELIVYKRWAEQSVKLWEDQKQPLEANKMKIAMRNAEKELYEIGLIEKFRKDELYEPQLQYGSNIPTTSLATKRKRKTGNEDN
ncbi:site-specific integrase [Paenibacillus polymyxa]|uniref:site-specific integrase n=1 Tax=Paenibacillus polymyxa TaxID=1406 RepID=UPI0025B71C36|nr:site-specific integrase [Paenibacillus polymyxa]MDN4106415.1 site-specific integrase [Paenibacillus polymyxa]